jgi:hypothetical protein
MCKMCGEWIDLGRTLSGDAALVSHEGSKPCLARVEMEIPKRVVQDAEEMRSNVLASPHTPFHARASSPTHFRHLLLSREALHQCESMNCLLLTDVTNY